MTATRTRTHSYIPLANPYLRCDQCGDWLTGWHDPDRCGCGTVLANAPCCCRATMTSACPSWSPVDGCQCQDHLGKVEHSEPPAREDAP